jgi:hypothetical protein
MVDHPCLHRPYRKNEHACVAAVVDTALPPAFASAVVSLSTASRITFCASSVSLLAALVAVFMMFDSAEVTCACGNSQIEARGYQARVGSKTWLLSSTGDDKLAILTPGF